MNWATIRDCRGKLAHETGTILKDWGGRIHVALIYPNRYSVGMSNLGLQTIYGLANSFDQVVFERVFFEGHEPASLESQRPLSDFDVFAFSFSYEHDYFNAARLLKSSGVPLFSRDRDTRHPLVIAGGAAVTANPEPVAQFIDCFGIGEAEAILPRMIGIFSEGLDLPREQLLEELSLVPGVYVPAFGDQTVIRQAAKNIDDFPTTSVVLNPQTELGDMYLIEIARGCARGCRFCLAGYQFRPARFRPVESLLAQVREGLRYRHRVGLVSAAISDHPQIEDLMEGLRGMGANFSASSIRIDPLPETLLQGLARSEAKTVTLAPEAGSQRLRNVVGKGISEEDILDAVSRVAAYNFKQIKLYFMIGLPTETDSDIVAIAHLIQSAKAVADRSRSGIHFTLNITPFVPKAGTPFQWMPMARKTVLKKRLAMLKKELRQQGVEVKADSIEWSLIQGMLARGDARLGTVIANMSKVNLSAWWQGLEQSGIDSDAIYQPIPFEERLPWERINSGTSRDRLQGELQKAILNEY